MSSNWGTSFDHVKKKLLDSKYFESANFFERYSPRKGRKGGGFKDQHRHKDKIKTNYNGRTAPLRSEPDLLAAYVAVEYYSTDV